MVVRAVAVTHPEAAQLDLIKTPITHTQEGNRTTITHSTQAEVVEEAVTSTRSQQLVISPTTGKE